MVVIRMAKSAHSDATKATFLEGARCEHAKLTAPGLESLQFVKRKVPHYTAMVLNDAQLAHKHNRYLLKNNLPGRLQNTMQSPVWKPDTA